MLEVKGIRKSYDSNPVLKGASLKVNDGSIYGLIGRNGAGKTTLMNIIVGLLPSDEGYVMLDGEVASPDKYIQIGYLPDLPAFFEYMNAGEYIDFLLKNQNPERRDELLSLVGIKKNTFISKMSRGMRQRLGIAAALVNDPDTILLDEPTSALDPQGRADVMEILLNLKKQGKTVVLSTHILADMEKICDDYGFLNNGVITSKADLNVEVAQSFVVTFKDDTEITSGIPEGISVEKISSNSYRFRAADNDKDILQKRILEYISVLDLPVRNIVNETLALDSLFKEVCSE